MRGPTRPGTRPGHRWRHRDSPPGCTEQPRQRRQGHRARTSRCRGSPTSTGG
jgi:hypothetical protein